MNNSEDPISKTEVNILFSMDRQLYSILVMSLARDPLETMHVMAFWLWLEQIGFKNLVKRQLSLSFATIIDLYNEALTCIKLISNGDHFSSSSSQYDIPWIKKLIGKQISLSLFYKCRFVAMNSLTKILSVVCSKVFGDIMDDSISQNSTKKISSDPSVMPNFQESLAHPNRLPVDRTLFVTFSKGYYVYEYMVWDLFTEICGPCIEYVQMENVQYGRQPLYAFVILHSKKILERILNGNKMVKYIFYGKHIWARKFKPIPPKTPVKRPY